jgi:hypothetical protein
MARHTETLCKRVLERRSMPHYLGHVPRDMTKAREIARRYPRLRARLDSASAGYAAAPIDTFEFGLRAQLVGNGGR